MLQNSLRIIYQAGLALGLFCKIPAFLRRFSLKDLQYKYGVILPKREKGVFWIHSVSLGETHAAYPIAKALIKRFPKSTVIWTSSTETGIAQAKEYGAILERVEVYPAPFDFSYLIKKWINRLTPQMYILSEGDFWPILLQELTKKKIPIAVINGKISERSHKRFLSLHSISKSLFSPFAYAAVQSEEMKDRYESLGVERLRIEVYPNSKWERDLRYKSIPQTDKIQIACVSTHEGEEEMLYRIYKQDRIVWIAPRHLHRIGTIIEKARRSGINLVRMSEIGEMIPEGVDGVIVDAMGYVPSIARSSVVTFVGGSLVPIGGHDLIEPLKAGSIPLFGPYIETQKEGARLLLEYKAGICIEKDSIEEVMVDLLQDRSKQETLKKGGKALLETISSSAEKIIEKLSKTACSQILPDVR